MFFFPRAVPEQDYDLQVFPSYSYAGATAVLRCLVPPFVGDFLRVEEWIAVDARSGRRQQLIRTEAWNGKIIISLYLVYMYKQ